MQVFHLQLCMVILWHVTLVNVVLGLRVWPFEPNPHLCGNGLSRIPIEFHCDGTNDCEDGSDEMGCESKDRPSFAHLDFMMLETNSSRLDKERYSWFWNTYHPIPIENAPRPGESLHVVELWKLSAPHSDPRLASFGWKHEGIGFLLKDVKGHELGRIAFQYWSASAKAPIERLPPLLLDVDGNAIYDEKGRIGYNSRAVVTYSRSRNNWESGYWKNNTLLSSLSKEKYENVLSFIQQWHETNQQFIPEGFIYNTTSYAEMHRHPKFLHRFESTNQSAVHFRDMGLHDWQGVGTVLQHAHSCLSFNIDVVKAASGIDLRTEHGGIYSSLHVVEPVELFAPAIRARELKHSGKLSLTWGQEKDDDGPTDGLIVIPAWFDSDRPLEQGDFVAKVHIVRPTTAQLQTFDDSTAKFMIDIGFKQSCKVLGRDGECRDWFH